MSKRIIENWQSIILALILGFSISITIGATMNKYDNYRALMWTDEILDGKTGNGAGDTVEINNLSVITLYSRDTAGTAVVTPQVYIGETDVWYPLDAITLSGTTSSVDAFPQITGATWLRAVVSSCSSCNVNVDIRAEKR